MKVSDWLSQAEQQLHEAGIATGRLDALVLLEDCLGKDRAYLLAHPELVLTDKQLDLLQSHITRRCAHEPLAYIRGHSEFYGRKFTLNAHVLEPRPESETMIDLLKQYAVPTSRIADIGCGSGALAITAKLEMPSTTVAAVDIDPACITVARQNADKHNANVQFFTGDLLQPLLENGSFTPDVLLCNLPYVPNDFHINRAATHEPKLALFGGPDGLDLYRHLFKQIDHMSLKPLVLTEALPPQHAALRDIAETHGYTQLTADDFIQVFSAV